MRHHRQGRADDTAAWAMGRAMGRALAVALVAASWGVTSHAWAWGEGGPPGWYVRADAGVGYTQPLGQLGEALDGSPLIAWRLLLGGGYRWWFAAVSVSATTLRSDEIDRSISDLWLWMATATTGLDIPLWEETTDRQRVGLTGRAEAGWAALDGSDDGYGHSGPTLGGGGGVFYERGEGGSQFLYRFWLDALWMRPLLDHPFADRRMYGDTLAITAGLTVLVWGLR